MIKENNDTIPVCRRCGRKLKSPESIALGFGTTCYKKVMRRAVLRPLFTIKKVCK